MHPPVGSQEKGDAHASRVQRIVRDSDARGRATKRLFDPLAILKCAGPESGQRQRAGLAVYSFSQRLVRRLLTAADEFYLARNVRRASVPVIYMNANDKRG